MGKRLESVASKEQLYVSALIREVMEALVVTRESEFANELGEGDGLEARLRNELIGLNESLIKIVERRQQVQGDLVRQTRKREHGFVEDFCEDEDEEPDEEKFGFDSEPIE